MKIDIVAWVESSDTVSTRNFRAAAHTTLLAISQTPFLQNHMVMKGGVLLAIKFKSSRFTKDVDFSSPVMFSSFDVERFLRDLGIGLLTAVEELPYGLDCKIQSHEVRPSREDATFQTLRTRIGYALKGTSQHKKLLYGLCPDILKIDFSFNEYNLKIETINFADGNNLKTYSLVDLVAEKYRAMIQQKFRNRTRRQDAYDIYWLLTNGYLEDTSLTSLILESLISKAASRGIPVDKHSLRDEEIRRRCELEYHTLAQEIEGDLPNFDEVYNLIQEYYESLPWK